jgi:hypothetical protein
MNAVQSQAEDDTYTWDIYVVPYLGGSAIAGIDPLLPLEGLNFTLELWRGSTLQTYYDTIESDPIPTLFPVFGPEREGYDESDLYPALFGTAANYLDTRGNDVHDGVDIIPKVLYDNPPVAVGWDAVNPELKKVYAVTDGTVYLSYVPSEDVYDMYLIPDAGSPYYGLSFGYVHVVPNFSQTTQVDAGDQIGVINNYQNDTRTNGQSHLHFEVQVHGTSPIVKKDPRQFIYPGLTPNP